ncbi:protein-L-isoaspartate(D-aspartate) O-methyltransferase [Sunxiuqinia sp. A32]|uniref:protein-L-isoaspartate(D-aspartate) O-methyltransferase n=1 Tax=Sunxiuqinia sp. A32 TaxID=3461496 RepID=UPI0040460E9B
MVSIGLHVFICGFSLILLGANSPQDSFEKERNQMVIEQIKSRGIRSEEVLHAMKKVKRHLFVPKPYQHLAYDDRPLPIGYSQTISQPYIVAFMTELILPEGTDRVLEIGTGSGYQAAVLAEIVDQVYTIELVEELGTQSAELLGKLRYDNVHVKIGDGYVGWEEYAPYDAIIVTAAADSIPQPLIDQLKEGGRMVIPVGRPSHVQILKLVEKKNGKVKTRNVTAVRFVPFVHE